MKERPIKALISDLTERGWDALAEWEDRRALRKHLESTGQLPEEPQDRSRRNRDVLGLDVDMGSDTPQVPALPMQTFHKRSVLLVEVFSFIASAMMYGVPTSAVFGSFTFIDMAAGSPAEMMEPSQPLMILIAIIMPFAAILFGQYLGKPAGLIFGLSVRSLQLFFGIAVIVGAYGIWANSVVQTRLVDPLMGEGTVEFITAVTAPIVIIAVYMLLIECLRHYGATLNGRAGKSSSLEAILGIAVGAVLGISSGILPDGFPTGPELLVPVLYVVTGGILVVGIVGSILAITRPPI